MPERILAVLSKHEVAADHNLPNFTLDLFRKRGVLPEIGGYLWRTSPDDGTMTLVAVATDFSEPTETFAEAAPTLGERRASKSSSGADWSPRDLLVRMLRDHDSGAMRLESVVVAYQSADDGPAGYWNATASPITAVGLLQMAIISLGMVSAMGAGPPK